MRGSYRKATTPSLTAAATSRSDPPACPEAKRSDRPPRDAQIKFLADLMRQRDERPEAVLDADGRLSGRDAWQAIDARKAVRP